MKKRFIVLISIIATILLAGGIFVSAYFGFFYKLQGSEIVMENVKFTVNDNPNKGEAPGEEKSIYLSNEDISKTDGYQIVLNYSLNGTFVSNYAMEYKTYFQVEDNTGISSALDLYRFDGGLYKYMGKLSNLAPYVNSADPVTPVYHSYLGAMGTHQEKFLLIYPMGTVLESNVSLRVKISTESSIALTDAEYFPYYYLNDIGVSDDGTGSGKKAENLFIALSETNEEATTAKNRTVVLMRDIIYSSKTDITFKNLLGLDLNGYTLDLKGGTIKFTDQNDVALNKHYLHPNIKFTDSKGSGVFKGKINLDYEESLVDVDDSFIAAIGRNSGSSLTIANASLPVYKKVLDENLANITKSKHLTTNGNYSFDAFGDLKNYSSLFSVSMTSQATLPDTTVSFDNSTKIVSVANVSRSERVNLNFEISKNTSRVTSIAVLELYGSSSYDCSEYLKSYLPKTLEGSIYLPTYIEAFNAFITWYTTDSNILTKNGELLPNGYKDLDNWYKATVDLGFVIDQNGEILNGVINNLEVIILTEEERANLIFRDAGVVFASENADTNKYSFKLIDLLAEKYNAYQTSGDPIDLSTIATEFNVTLTESTYQAKVDELIAAIKTKLGLKEITVTPSQESTYVTETTEAGSITTVTQLGLPTALVVLGYDVTITFDNGTSTDINIAKNKVISINAASQVVSFVDLTNTLRVPFDTYSKYMTEYTIKTVDAKDYNVYNPYSNSFELVSSFNDTAITYTVPAEYRDYVSIKTYSNGTKVLEIAKDNVPADTHTVTISANIEGFDDPIYLPFTCVGVLHNASSLNHAEFEDGKLYIELLNLYDINKDQVLTDLEAVNSPITSVTITDKNITSLVGLRYFNKLTVVNLYSNQIVNIDDLAYLTGLVSANLNNNKIASLEPLRYLNKLGFLYVSSNQLSTIEPIQYLTSLNRLWVDQNYITDFQYIQNLTNLTELGVSKNRNSSDIYSVWLNNDAEGLGNYTYVIRGNQYYFNLLAQKRGSQSFKLVENNDVKSSESISSSAKTEALYLSMIEPIYKTSNVVVLPTYFTAPNGTVYPITYSVTDEYSDFITITKVDSGTDVGKITNITLNQLPIDKEIIIYANIIGLAENQDLFYRPIKLFVRKGSSNSRLFGAVEVSPNYWVMGEDLVKDSNLLSSLWAKYDLNHDGKITNEELKHESSGVTLDLENREITSLAGIEYFGNIKSINLRNNTLELNDSSSGRDTECADISHLAYLSSLETLYLNGQYFDFDDLLNYSRLKDGSSFNDTRSETLTVTKAMLVDSTHTEDDPNNLFDKSVDIEFTSVGLTSLKKLNVNGSQKLSEYSVQTKLYHVFMVNKSITISKDSAGVPWNPIEQEINKIIGSMTASAKFVNYNDRIEIKRNYEFYLYDDLYPTSFSLGYTDISDDQYVYSAVTNANFGPTTNSTFQNVYLADGTLYTLSGIDTTFVDKKYHKLKSYFNISTDSTNVIITYKKLTYRDYQAYLEMNLTTSALANGRRNYSASSTYFMTLFMQYNNEYTIYDDNNIDASVNGKPLNAVFGSTEAMLFVMNSLSDSLYGGRSSHYFTVIKNDGTVEKYYHVKNNGVVASGDYAEGDANYAIDADDAYTIKSTRLATFSGTYDGGGNFTTSKYFFISGNFMPTASSAVDGLRFLPQIKKVYIKNDAVLGTGKDLVNLEELFICYSYFDIKGFDTVLPKLKYLTISQSTATNISDEKDTDSNPNNLIETYMVYMPNLIQFHFNGEGVEEKGQMYEWSAFLAYSYIPYNQVHDSRYYHTENGKEYVGGMELDSDKYYYWYDETIDEDNLYNNFKDLYYKSGNVYYRLDEEHVNLSITSDYYNNIYTDDNGVKSKLPAGYQIFRHVKKGTVKLNNFKLSRGSSAYDSGTNKYSNTYENQIALMEIYNNLANGSQTHFYIAPEPHVDNGDSYDFDPTFTPVTFATTLTDEYNEIAPTVADLHVRLYGYKFDGTDLWEEGIGTEYAAIDWTDTDYTDYFRQKLLVRLPLRFNDFMTGNTAYDKKYRSFTISWYASYVTTSYSWWSGYTYTTQYTPIRIGTAVYDSVNDKITCSSENMSSSVFRKYYTGSSDYVDITNQNSLLFYLDNPGYYIFEGVLELIDYEGNSYAFNTKYDARSASLVSSGSSYTYSNNVTGSVSVIYPITITSFSDSEIDNDNNISSRKKSITKIHNYTPDSSTLKWFDVVVDRTFKFFVFSNFAKTGISQTESSYDLSIGTNSSNLNPFTSDDSSRIRIYDKYLNSFYDMDSYSEKAFTSNSITDGLDINSKSQFAVKTFAGLERFLSDIFTLDGWDVLKLKNFYYKYASNLTYMPVKYPSTLEKLYVSSTYGITYYGGVFNSNVTDARFTYYSTHNADSGSIADKYAIYSYQTDSMFDIYDYPDLVAKINDGSVSSITLPMSVLTINSLTEESYTLLAKLSTKLTSKLTIYLSNACSTRYLYNFTDYNMVKNFCDTINTDKLDIILDGTCSNNVLSGGTSMVTILRTLVTDYAKVTSTTSLKSDHWYETTSPLSNTNKVAVKSFTGTYSTYYWNHPSDGPGDNPDFYPDLTINQNIEYNVAIRYTIGDNKRVQLLKTLSSNVQSSEVLNTYTYEIATFKTGVRTGLFTSNSVGGSYTANDLNFYSTDKFDSNFVKFLINMTKSYGTGLAAQAKINGANKNVVKGPILFRSYNQKTKVYDAYKPGEDNSTDVQYPEGYIYILDKDIKSGEKKYVIIVNSEFLDFDLAVDGNIGGVQSQSYTTLDVKGFELLPFKGIVQGNGANTKGGYMYITKIINSNNTLTSGYSAKLQYIEINNKEYNETIGFNQSGSETYTSMVTTVCSVDNLAMSLADNATIVIGDRAKILQRFLQYDTTNGITLKNNESKTIYVKLDYSKMHLLFFNYAGIYTNGSTTNFDNAYDTSFNYQVLKKEILAATKGEDTLFYKDYHDYYTPIYTKLVNFAGGGLTNITMHNNLQNHPFYSEYRGVLGDDSSYNYYINTKNSSDAKIVYSGAKYDPNKLFGTIMNVHSNNIRSLSNKKNISMYFESDNIEAVDDANIYIISDSVKLKLPKSINGKNVIYLPVETYFATSELMQYSADGSSRNYKSGKPISLISYLYYEQYYGFEVPSTSSKYALFDIFVIKEYNSYFEISLKDTHTNYTAMRYMFRAFEYEGAQFSDSNPEASQTYTISEWFRTKTKYAKALNYDYSFNVDKGASYAIKTFYVDVNTNPAIGRQTIKPDDPLYLPISLTLVGTDYTLTYTVEGENAAYLSFDEQEIIIDEFTGRKQTFMVVSLTNAAVNVKDVKITATVKGIRYTYTTGPVIGGADVTYYVEGQSYVAWDGTKWRGPIEDEDTFDYVKNDLGWSPIRTYNAEGKIAEPHEYDYTTFNFYVDIAANANAARNTEYAIQNNDLYAEVLVNTETQEIVSGTLVNDYLDGSGNPVSGYEYQIRRADTIFESGSLLTDIYYPGGISLGSTDYTRHDFVTTGLNVDYFAKYAVVDVSKTSSSANDYRSIFVTEDSKIKTYARDKVTYTAVTGLEVGVSKVKGYYTYADSVYTLITDSTETAADGVTYYSKTVDAEEYAKTNSNYRLALLLTKEQIANIHYFSSTSINISNSVTFRAQSSLEGIEIFPLTNIRLGFHNAYSHSYNSSSVNSRAFSGNMFESLSTMKLTEFTLVFKYTTIFINDWTFLFNSRDTLKTFIYGGVYTGQGETYGTTHDDFSFLLSFDNLENVRIYGFSGIEKTQNFKYLASTLYLKYGKNILTYYYNNNTTATVSSNAEIVKTTSADIAVAIPILYKFHTEESITSGTDEIDSSFTYRNSYELHIGANDTVYSDIDNYDSANSSTQYLLPSYINDSGTYYKLTYDSLSSFMNVVAVDIETNEEYSMLQYQELYENYVFSCLENNVAINDYDFAKGYRIYARFSNLRDCLTDRIMISAKIECNSKMASKDEILLEDNSTSQAKDNYKNGTGYADIYYDGNSYIYTPYTYERFLSIYIDHTDVRYE